MRGKILIVTGLAVGYVLGARAGRERYEEIKRVAAKFWNDPRVQHQVENVEEFAKDKAPEVVEFLSDNAKKVVSQVRSTKNSTKNSTKSPTRKSTGKSGSTSSAKSTSGARKTSGTSSSSTSK